MIEKIKGMIMSDDGCHPQTRARVKRLEFDIGVSIARWVQGIEFRASTISGVPRPRAAIASEALGLASTSWFGVLQDTCLGFRPAMLRPVILGTIIE